MKNLILQKRITVQFLFVFTGIIFLLCFTNPSSAQSKKNPETYKSYIKKADQAFIAEDYQDALLLYEKASQAKPEYNYATDRINEIKKILESGPDSKIHPPAQNKTTSASYKTLLAKADKAFAEMDYPEALLYYNKARLTKPDYNYAPDKIDEIQTILNATPSSKAQLFDTLVQKAGSFYTKKNYKEAKTEYEKAMLVDTSAQLPKERLKQISSDYVDPDDMANFNIAIANGDKELEISDFDHAIVFYEAALTLHPNTKFVKEKITLAKKQKAEYIAKKEQAATNLASADKPVQPGNSTKATNAAVIPGVAVATESQQQTEQKKYEAALEKAENRLKAADYQAALIGFKSALAIKPDETYPKNQITDIEKIITENTSWKAAFDLAIKNGDQSMNEKQYDVALSNYRNALAIFPAEKYPSQKIEEITAITAKQKDSDENYNKSVAEADKQFNENKFEEAVLSYNKALGYKPSEAYPKQKISEANAKLTLIKSMDEKYTAAIASGDQFLSASKYSEALNAYKQALSIKPNEAYPTTKTTEINSILAKQKTDSENYEQAIRTGEKALAAGNLTLALTSFQDAQKIKPSERYPLEQITEIKLVTANQQKKEDKYATTLKTADQLFAGKDYKAALAAYTEASELKKSEKYPQEQIVKINAIIADSRTVDDSYNSAIAEGDKLFETKDYAGAIASFTKATGLKPAETYPKERLTEINKIVGEIAQARSSEYVKALEDADKLYNTKVYDQAIEAYEAAVKINQGDQYPELQIAKIRKYMSDHAILDLNTESIVINKGDEKKFAFAAIDPSLRKNNYILIKARSAGKIVPKVYLNYGKDDTKNGGIVLRKLEKSTMSDFLIRISVQDKWFRDDNNWISLSVETGDIEITKIQIAAGD